MHKFGLLSWKLSNYYCVSCSLLLMNWSTPFVRAFYQISNEDSKMRYVIYEMAIESNSKMNFDPRGTTHRRAYRRTNPTGSRIFFSFLLLISVCVCVSISNKTSLRDFEIEYVTDRTNRQTATVHLTNIANNNKNKYK